MVGLPLLLVAGLAGSNSGGPPAWVREYTAAYSASYSANANSLIPAWARKYNMNCSGCHYPAPPRLNATGLRFRWAGYRMPEEIGEKADVEKVQNYFAAGAEMGYEYEKTSGQPTTTDGFTVPAVTLFYAGPVGTKYSAFAELEHGPEGEIERIVHVSTLWGREAGYGGLRVGLMHNLSEWGVAGFDRLVGISAPSPLDGSVTGAVPFALGTHALGLEGYYVRGSNRLSAQLLNGITTEGEPGATDLDTRKDFLVTDQYIFDKAGSGIQAVAYYGTIVGLDTSLASSLSSHFVRLGLTANKIYRDFELLGGVIWGKDTDLPGGAADNKGLGYWVSGQYFLPQTPLAVYGRFEVVDPNTQTADDANRRYVLGLVLPINLPQYLRWAVEYRLDQPQGGLPKTNNVATQLLINF